MNRPDLQALIPSVKALAVEAGLAILTVYNTAFAVTQKDDNTPVTEADFAAHRVIRAGLNKLTPEIPQICEESHAVDYAHRANWSRLWLIDPLDGTREFIKRNGEFTVNIALIENHIPIMGVIHAPVTGVTYFAAQGLGAFKKIQNENSVAIHTRRAPDCKIVAGSRSHAGRSLQDFLEKVGDFQLLPMGSSLKSCLVAEGRADVYPRLGRTCEWDTAAAQCIVEEAGGAMFDTQHQPLRYNTREHHYNPSFLVVGDDTVDWMRYLS